MKKALSELGFSVLFIGGLWFLLSQVNWVSLFKIKQNTAQLEQELGKVFSEYIEKTEQKITEDAIALPVDSLLSHLCTKNDVERSSITLHLVEDETVNAYVVPGRHMVVYSGLLKACENEAELSGVLGHELAHMEKNHVMRKLIREVGLAALVSMTTGSTGAEGITQLVKVLSSSAYDREMEREADLTSVDYLINADINPEPFAEFLYKTSGNDAAMPEIFSWISTHPGSEERAKDIIHYTNEKSFRKTVHLNPETWKAMKEKL